MNEEKTRVSSGDCDQSLYSRLGQTSCRRKTNRKCRKLRKIIEKMSWRLLIGQKKCDRRKENEVRKLKFKAVPLQNVSDFDRTVTFKGPYEVIGMYKIIKYFIII